MTRDQIGRGADWVKIYADYRWGPDGTAQPTFTEGELRTVVEVAESSGRWVVAHATNPGVHAPIGGSRDPNHRARRRGDQGGLSPHGRPGRGPLPHAGGRGSLRHVWWMAKRAWTRTRPGWSGRKESFRLALEEGVPICFGGDVGVFDHGDNVWELELMVEYGMPVLDALRSATSVKRQDSGAWTTAWDWFGKDYLADLIAVEGDPTDGHLRPEAGPIRDEGRSGLQGR